MEFNEDERNNSLTKCTTDVFGSVTEPKCKHSSTPPGQIKLALINLFNYITKQSFIFL